MLDRLRGHRAFALTAAAAAVSAGCLLLLLFGAPLRMPVMNFAALLIGLTALLALRAAAVLLPRPIYWDWVLLGTSLLVPLTALFGVETDGVARWMVIAGLTTQPALTIVPPLAIAFAIRPSPVRAAAIGCAAVGVAMQPDSAAAAMLALGSLAAVAGRKPTLAASTAAAAAAGALFIAWWTSPLLPPVAFVEQVLPTALGLGVITSFVAAVGLALVFLPALTSDPCATQTRFAFAGVWLGAVLAALAGSYPTPILGFGGSAILGYVLSVGLLHPLRPKAYAGHVGAPAQQSDEHPRNDLRFA
jgi:hypothetical protein